MMNKYIMYVHEIDYRAVEGPGGGEDELSLERLGRLNGIGGEDEDGTRGEGRRLPSLSTIYSGRE